MADGKKKQPLSLNQLHNRFLNDLSASHSKPKPRSVNDDPQMKLKKLDKEFNYIEEENDDVPRFDFGSPSPPFQALVNVDEPVSKRKDSSPQLFAGIGDFDSLSSTLVAMNPKHVELESGNELGEKGNAPKNLSSLSVSASVTNPSNSISYESNTTLPVAMKPKHVELESGNESEKKDNASKNISSLSGVGELDCDFPGQERRMKVRIEGRSCLCKISKNDDGDAVIWQNLAKDDKQGFDAIADFDSPLEVNTTFESKGSEIRDILNELSSKFEILSIEKKRVLKKVELEDFKESERCKLYDLDTKDEFREYQTATSSSLYASDFPAQKVESEMVGSISNESQAYCCRRENKDCRADDYGLLSERNTIKQGDRRQQKFIELSDDESDEVTILGDHVDEFTLSGPRGTYRLPGKIAKMLYPHQREGLKWLWSLHCKGKGGILGDDMGLGKTMQICGYIAGLFHSNMIRRVLIVAPKTLLTHWINELSTVGLSLKTREYFSTCTKTRHYELQYILQDKGILLTTYDIVRNNVKSLCGDYYYRDDKEEDETIWDYMILDEGHLIKNPSTQRAKSLLQIPCLHRIIISGTPLQNNLKELWALFSFCCPELLGDKKEFKEKYEQYINRGNEKNASDREKRIGSFVAKDLRECIQPYFLRRLKSEVFHDDASLSKKNEIIVWLRLTQCQRQLYEAFLKSEIVISACDGSPLAAITILKKICDHPLLLTKRAAEDVLEGMDAVGDQQDDRIAEKLAMQIADVAERFDIVENDEISCKLSFVLSLLGDLIPKGHNVLIFSQTRKMLNLIQESLISNQYKYMRIDGTTKISDRAKIVKDFQEGRGAPIFLLTSQVGGLGLTLTNADRVIVVDPAWNPSSDNQSVDRAYRIGQKKDVIVYRLMTCGTVEEKIYRKQVFKGGLFRSATEHKEQIRYFSQQHLLAPNYISKSIHKKLDRVYCQLQDLKDLFNLPKQGFDISLTQQQLLEEHDQQDTMEESLRAHVAFLETLNIAGVSQHSLLFSKAAPLQAVEIEEDERRIRGSTFMGNASRRTPVEPNVDGSHFSFNPKDVKNIQKSSNPDVKKPSETEIRERINRLTQMFANKVAISKLPDKGDRIHKQIAALNHQLDQMGIEKRNKDDVIEL